MDINDIVYEVKLSCFVCLKLNAVLFSVMSPLQNTVVFFSNDEGNVP